MLLCGAASPNARRGESVLNEAEPKGRAELKVGDVIGDRYELRCELGKGAGGQVFEALHRITHRTVAIKVVSPDVPRSLFAQQSSRLLREARALAAVRHPGVVEVLDGGLLSDGSPFVVLEKLEGRTLEGLLAARGKIGKEDTVAIGLQLADALDAMHRAGVIHRDLKPGNIFVVRDKDGTERLKLLDFDIARVPTAAQDRLTGIGALIGTPAYMSPEQLLGIEVDARADIYGAGVTLFECITGRLPYEGNYQSVLLQVCAPDAKPPSLLQLSPDAGPDLAAVVARALARSTDERFPAAVDLGRALYAVLPQARSRTFFLGPPPAPRFGPPASRQAILAEQRRKSPRVGYATPMQILLPTGNIDGRTEDISEGGALLICRESCEVGGQASIRFALPIEGKVVTCPVHVRWVRAARPNEPDGPRAIGVEFIEPTDAMRASIGKYVELMSRS